MQSLFTSKISTGEIPATAKISASEPAKRFLFFVNREVRRVPLDWQHPLDKSGRPIPLLAHEPGATIEDSDSQMPYFSTVPSEQMGICAYETTSEGTPLSPVFPDTPEGRFALANYCAETATVFADHRADVSTWCNILFGQATAVVDPTAGTVEILEPARR
jgi:hypothetical protein